VQLVKLEIEHHVYFHSEQVTQLLGQLQFWGAKIMGELDDLKAKVAANTSVLGSSWAGLLGAGPAGNFARHG
jgi:hypothetical protein